MAVAGSVLANIILFSLVGSGAVPSSGPSTSLVELRSSDPVVLTHLPERTLSEGGLSWGLGPRENAWQRALTMIPMGHPTENTVRVRDLGPTVAAATTVPVASASREPLDLITGAMGPPVRARFMGVEASGRRFCIIADRSGSMQFEGKLAYLKKEVLKTAGDIKGGARFFVILFNDNATAIPANHWLGGKADVDATERWLETVVAQGSTDPLPAFQVAFKMRPKPDAIFFMTDGIIQPTVPGSVLALNAGKRRVPIHAISLIDREGEPLLRQIAKQSGGTYRHVSGF